ncbi:hypothetical protein LOTGIDRAFT_231177 [Lottia gigantea]|uniref:C2H2-type domain-containing protein n=1 Tax=Lottia gigantea TaxID=225164 RepID=V4ANQ0_LOTGI|nr:hypothetical protein LOTGIDRAFT_231177 [Lottia gigantea]ESO98797.1 hypothetical protein LOTGIDRAFT_231177 [Lottia gigantea]
MTNNCSLPSNNMNPPPPCMSMSPNFAHPHHGFGPQQYWHQFYGNNGQQQFSNHPPMQSMSHIPNLMQMTGGFQNMNSNCKRKANNIWSQQSQDLDNDRNGIGRGQKFMQGRQFHQNQSKWNRYGCQNENNRNQKKSKNQQKKEKVDKRDLAENNVFYCDACDRGFKTEQVYTEHVDNHQKCSYKGCSYVAAPKLVELHCKLQHRNGYAKKIWSLESKEDVENWIKARKSNYPTAANITKKKTLNTEKIQRGEVLETKQFGKMKGRGRYDKRNGNGNWKRKHSDSPDCQDNKKRKTDYEKNESLTDKKEDEAIRVDDPLSILIHSATPPISKDLNAESNNDTSEKQSVGLTSILTCYGSDTDSSDHDEEVTTGPSDDKQIKEIPTTIYGKCIDTIENKTATACKADDIENKEQNKESGNSKRKRNRNKKNATYNNEPRKKKPSLLEMLLAKEIRHERNVILQCVHYIVKKTF